MKKIKYLIFVIFTSVIGIYVCSAASLTVSANKKTVTVGSTVTVTVNASGAAGWEYCIDYDSSMFSLSSSTVGSNGSQSCVLTGSTLTGGSSVKFVLKAKKSGSSTISLRSANMYDDNGSTITFSKGSVTVKARTQAEIEASYSDNANLSNLRIVDYEISPEFDKDTLEYELEVENDIEKITIKATKADSGASVSGTGDKNLTEGVNVFKIVVTAEKGNTKTYTINVNRKELNPIEVNIDNKQYTVVRKSEALEAPTYYTLSSVVINDEEVPAFISEITGYVLVGLKDSDGNIDLYSYDNGDYKIYKQIGTNVFTFIFEETTELISGYEKTKEITINNLEVTSYVGENDTDIVLVYGMNASSGDRGWYKYDTKEGTFQRYIALDSKIKEDNGDLYFWLTIVFAILSGVTIILVIVLMSLNSKIRKKNNKLVEMLKGSAVNTVNTGDTEEKEEASQEESEKVDNEEKISIEETIINNIAKANGNDDEELDETKTDLDESIHDTEILKEIKVRELEKEDKKLSKRELRRLEKEKEAKEQEELKKMRDDFLKTEEHEIVSTEEKVIEEEKPKKGRGRRKKK